MEETQDTKLRADVQESFAKAGRLGGRCSGCKLSAGVRPAPACGWPTDVSALRQHRCSLQGFPDFRGKCGGSKLWKTVAATSPRFLTHHQALDCRKKTFLNARTGFCLQRITFSQRSGARDLPSGGRADGRNQAGFTPAVKRRGRRASSVSVQRVQN